jgi:hypothetical protein
MEIKFSLPWSTRSAWMNVLFLCALGGCGDSVAVAQLSGTTGGTAGSGFGGNGGVSSGGGWGGSPPNDGGPGGEGGSSGCAGAGQWVPALTEGAPSPRFDAIAAWSGTEMLVWGGAYLNINIDMVLGDGARYDPAKNAWTPIQTTSAPTARTGAVGVWTGTGLFVWGGTKPHGFAYPPIDGGAIYDPILDVWVPVSETGAPLHRTWASGVWTGTDVIVWGGADTPDHLLKEGGRYNPATAAWTPISTVNAPEPRSFHHAVWTGSVMVIWGGIGSGGTPLATGGRYAPVSDSWSPVSLSGAPSARIGSSVIWTGDRVVVWGGAIGDPGNQIDINDGAIYDPVADAWTSVTTANAPAPRQNHRAIWSGSRMIVWGGQPESSREGGLYNLAADAWEPTSLCNAPHGRSSHAAVWTGTTMMVWGGWPGYVTGGIFFPP